MWISKQKFKGLETSTNYWLERTRELRKGRAALLDKLETLEQKRRSLEEQLEASRSTASPPISTVLEDNRKAALLSASNVRRKSWELLERIIEELSRRDFSMVSFDETRAASTTLLDILKTSS